MSCRVDGDQVDLRWPPSSVNENGQTVTYNVLRTDQPAGTKDEWLQSRGKFNPDQITTWDPILDCDVSLVRRKILNVILNVNVTIPTNNTPTPFTPKPAATPHSTQTLRPTVAPTDSPKTPPTPTAMTKPQNTTRSPSAEADTLAPFIPRSTPTTDSKTPAPTEVPEAIKGNYNPVVERPATPQWHTVPSQELVRAADVLSALRGFGPLPSGLTSVPAYGPCLRALPTGLAFGPRLRSSCRKFAIAHT